MACHLYGATPLPELILIYYQIDSWEKSSIKFLSKLITFHSQKSISNAICTVLAILSMGPGVNKGHMLHEGDHQAAPLGGRKTIQRSFRVLIQGKALTYSFTPKDL